MTKTIWELAAAAKRRDCLDGWQDLYKAASAELLEMATTKPRMERRDVQTLVQAMDAAYNGTVANLAAVTLLRETGSVDITD